MEVSARDFFKISSNDRGTSWGEIETKVLIKIWADDTIQAMLNGLTHNHKVFLQISEVMKCRGYNRNPKQCREKIKKLRLEYKRIVEEKKNGSEKGETTWKFFEAMHEVLGRPAPTCGRNSAAREEEDDDEDDEEDYDDDETTTSEDEEEDEPRHQGELPPAVCYCGTGWMAEVRFAQGRKDPGSGQERTQEISKMSSGATGAIWTDAETKVLIEIWADDAIQAMLNTSRHNKEIYLQISEEMKFRGYNRGAKQCREKINKLRSLYKRIAEVKKNNSEKAGITWTFFKAMDEVLGRPAPQRPAVPLQTCGRNSAAREEDDDDDDDDDETTTSEDEEEDEAPCVRHDAPRKDLVLFSTKHDIALLGEVVALNPFASREPGRMWDFVGDMVTDALQGNFEVDGKTCRERTMLLLDYYKKQDFPSLRRFGTERLYAKKEDLLRQVMELEAEKSSTVNGDGPKNQPEERRDQINEELAWSEPEKPDITTLPPAGGMDVNTSSLLVAAEAEDERAPAAELPAAPAAKRPCHCCFQTYAGILSFLEKRSEAEQRLREEELSFRRQELEIQRSKIALERERLEVERKERERRFELESQERQVVLNLLKEKVLRG